jgi:acyl carrier protein
MDKKYLHDRIIEIIESLVEGEISILDETDVSEIFDSIQFVKFIVEIEDKFNIELNSDDFELDKFKNVNVIVDLLMGYIN